MTQPSNLYSTRLYSEHPIGLWPIDDDLTFLSLIPKAGRDLRTWQGTVTEYGFEDDFVSNPPFDQEKTYEVSGSTQVDVDGKTYHMTETSSQNLFDFYTGLNHDQRVFSINAYVHHRMPAAFYEIGYMYESGGQDIRFIERLQPGPPNEWIRLGRTFDQTFMVANARVFIRVYFPEQTDTSFLVNGVSVGQWSETMSAFSTGVYSSNIPKQTGLPLIYDQDLNGLELREYGPGTDTGYALVQNNRLLAVNGGIPLVYGSNSVTTLIPSTDTGTKLPSIVVPGKGMLNNSGRFNSYTFEAWIRIDNASGSDRRIIGPVSSSDGIYVRGNSIAMRVGNDFRSFCVGEWYRPMLLHLTISDTEIAMMINGERVMSMPYSKANAVLPTNRLRNEDWIGFYSWADVRVFEVDTVSIFPYVVPAAVAKRRFVWGQGVEDPETINSAYLGSAHTVDFAYANYHTNHSYPESARWDRGHSDNLVASRFSLKPHSYALPTLVSQNRTLESIMDYSGKSWGSFGGPTYLSFASGSVEPTYLFFADANQIVGDERVVYGVFSGTHDEETPLLILEHKISGVQLRANIINNTIKYYYDGALIQTGWVLDTDQPYTVGFDFHQVSREIANFMSDSSMIEVYVGGDRTYTFTGKIYRVGFAGVESSDPIIPNFGNDGIIDPSADLIDFVAGYTLIPISAYGMYYLDISTAGTWTDTYPVGFLSSEGVIDLIQFSLGAQSYDATARVDATITFDDLGGRTDRIRDRIVAPDSTGVIDLRNDPEPTSAFLHVSNGTIIMPPRNSSGLTMRLKLSVKVAGIRTSNLVIKDMSIASVANSTEKFFEVGTAHGYDIAPYTKVGNYYSTHIDRPWAIHKQSAPYLYLTNDSGLRPLSNNGNNNESGLWITMNRQRDRDFKVSSMQIWVKLVDEIGDSPVELFSVKSDRAWIKFVGVDDGTGTRARVYAIDGWTGQDHTEIKFHQDGNQVVMPFIQNNHWTAIGIDFEPLLDFAGDIGAICLISGCVYNNIVYYRTSSLQEQYTFAYRTWGAVKNDGANDLTWGYWRDQFNGGESTWDDVAKTATITHGISIDEIYKTYVGTNRVVTEAHERMLLFDGGQSTVISGEQVLTGDQHHTKYVSTSLPKWHTVTEKPV